MFNMPFVEQSPRGAGISIAIDRGGTFTDCLGIIPGKPDILVKLLSNDPTNYSDACVLYRESLSEQPNNFI
jgi:5-oxoprolinase (ATP-hydrolysing)